MKTLSELKTITFSIPFLRAIPSIKGGGARRHSAPAGCVEAYEGQFVVAEKRQPSGSELVNTFEKTTIKNEQQLNAVNSWRPLKRLEKRQQTVINSPSNLLQDFTSAQSSFQPAPNPTTTFINLKTRIKKRTTKRSPATGGVSTNEKRQTKANKFAVKPAPMADLSE